MTSRRPPSLRSPVMPVFAVASVLMLGLAASALAQQDVADTYKPDEIERFCGNIADAARDRRHANQLKELEALKSDIDARVAQLEAKRVEYEQWMKLRQDFMAQASETVVKIYARMKPDAAAERLVELDPQLAAAIILKLDVKQSGLILGEMERTAVAKLTGIMADASRKKDPS
jgi:flagellar motility protein MotE (MotC chaperone)